mmetsp:Transcript_16777/g.42216  ORF Transcript_16777/g.42216 Transcript_16777/m.42216 type:complete len:171 (+) Transcript_16777:36-548(+)
MAVLSVALLLVLSLSAQASAGEPVCAGASGILSMVTDLAPVCFKNCQQLCGPLDTLVTEYMATQDVDALKAKVCAQKGIFDCLYEEGNADECRKVLVAGSTFGVKLPMSAEDLKKQCPSNSGAGDGGAHNIQVNNTNNTNKDVLTSGATVSIAASASLMTLAVAALGLAA